MKDCHPPAETSKAEESSCGVYMAKMAPCLLVAVSFADDSSWQEVVCAVWCCSAAALLLTSTSPLSTPSDYMSFFLFFELFLYYFTFLLPSSLPFISAFLCFFYVIGLCPRLSVSVSLSVFPHSSSLSYFMHQLLSRFQSVTGLLARLPAFTTCLQCVRTCTTGSNRIPRMCVSSPAR